MSKSVYINRVSKFLPNEPISNNEMEDVLGMVNGKPSKAKGMILRSNGIKTRYYALDKNGNTTHTNAQLTAEAVRSLSGNGLTTKDIDLLVCGTTSPDQLLPSHSSMVHGELGDVRRETATFTSSCCSGIAALRYAYLSVKTGERKNAVATGSERLSTWMKAEKFQHEIENLTALKQNPYLAFEKEFLRWMLSDGASAVLLQDHPNENGPSLKIDWIEMTSFGNELDACMYSGGLKNEDGGLTGWSDMDAETAYVKTVFSLKQDVKLLRDYIVPKGFEFFQELVKKYNLDVNELDYFLPHLSSNFFQDPIYEILDEHNLTIPREKWFLNLFHVGNVGSASAFLMLEELFNSGKLKKGDKILLMIPESARFVYAYVHLTVE